jgi:hypothetical protein
VGIVVHPDEVVAQREVMDDDGVVHAYDEVLAGEAMEGGPVMLSWRDVADAGETAASGYNVVIHEFAHVLDMGDGAADGCAAPAGGLHGHAPACPSTGHLAPDHAGRSLTASARRSSIAERFGGEADPGSTTTRAEGPCAAVFSVRSADGAHWRGHWHWQAHAQHLDPRSGRAPDRCAG